jgi:hypothetical protein
VEMSNDGLLAMSKGLPRPIGLTTLHTTASLTVTAVL